MPRVMSTLSQRLLDWFAIHKKPLPWRENNEPYRIWISEVMLQQTQRDRVGTYFRRFLERFPDVASLAASREDDLLKLWEGLGYYSRARNLRKAAAIIIDEHGGSFPDSPEALLALPGIGRYTAGAILSIAYNKPEPIVDANVERVFARVFDLDLPVKDKTTSAFLWTKARELIPKDRAREFNQAVMELGSLVCLSRKPRCSACPIQPHCEAYRLDIVLERPVPAKAKEYIPLEVATGLLVHQGLIFVQKRPTEGVWAGLWEFPGGSIEAGETPEQAVVREYQEETEFDVGDLEKIAVVRHGYTKYRVALHCYFCALTNGRREPVLHAAQESRWVRPEELASLAMPAGHRKLLDLLVRDLRFAERLRRP
ncbi:A/G-specific adenine glycosylase [Desulfocurvibacter africanus]|uniref:A/G-specific adenine glycosylase n=1 Tax=Desulfocurvibacter africanus TaxID=873 RepID=UPI002FDA5E60